MIELAASSSAFRLLILAVIFAVVTGIAMLIVSRIQLRRRAMRQIARLEAENRSINSVNLLQNDQGNKWAQMADAIEKAGISLTDTSNLKLEKQLKLAGFRNASAPRLYTLVRIALVFILPGIYLAVTFLGPEPPDMIRVYLFCIIFACAGLYIPNLFIRAKADRRQQEIVNGFPDTLDLILVCVEAGLGLEAALDRVGREIVRSNPLIAALLVETTVMMRAGASRELALRSLADNSGVDEIRSFSTLLIQSDKLGTSIANTLRIYAQEMREARRMRAEENAHRLRVLISIPLVVCMLPTMIGVLLLPAIVGYVRHVGPAMTGGG